MAVEISIEELKDLAGLVKLDLAAGLAPEEAETRLRDAQALCSGFMRALSALESADAEDFNPVYLPPHILGLPLPLRPDKAEKACSRSDLLDRAPESDGEYFVVPAMI